MVGITCRSARSGVGGVVGHLVIMTACRIGFRAGEDAVEVTTASGFGIEADGVVVDLNTQDERQAASSIVNAVEIARAGLGVVGDGIVMDVGMGGIRRLGDTPERAGGGARRDSARYA